MPSATSPPVVPAVRKGEAFSLGNGTMSGSTETEGISRMTKDMKNLVKRIQDLRHLGIEDSKIALPKICVVGDQSTGKSSLIEGMAEIKVPRSSGTCTRCPIEINLSESDKPWQCVVSLSKGYAFIPRQRISKANPLGSWAPQDPQEEHFITLNRKEEVQEAIKCAQVAILNPQNDSSLYVPGGLSSSDTYTKAKFSPNVVRLAIAARGFPNLAFYDLPGVISQAEHESEAYLVTIVESLVKQYVSQESCIVLLTLPMTDDATNSSAARIVREMKATQRTLGVLTKPDRMEDIGQWADLLGGHKFLLGHGYYVIRNNPDPTVDHLQARHEENSFFRRVPWTSDLAMFQSKFGTRNLQSALSELLLAQIKKCLPDVISQINEKAERINHELELLPDPVKQHNPYALCAKVQELKGRVEACVDGGMEIPMLKIFNHIASDFRLALQQTRPTLKMICDQDIFHRKTDEADSDCEIVPIMHTPKKRTSYSESKPATPSISRQKQFYQTEHFNNFKGRFFLSPRPAHNFHLTDIRNINEDHSTGTTLTNIHPQAIDALNKQSVTHWRKPLDIFLGAVHKLVKRHILDQVNKVFAPYRDTELHRQVSSIVEQHILQLKQDLDLQASELLALEVSKPFTMDHARLHELEKRHLEDFSRRRKYTRTKKYLESQGELPDDATKVSSRIQQFEVVEPDPFEKEIKMMASSRAYYELASVRFVDSLCQNVHIKLFWKCKEMHAVIEDKLGVYGQDSTALCARLMAQDPERQRLRESLVKEQVKLGTAQEWLATISMLENESNVMDYDENTFAIPPPSTPEEDSKSQVFRELG
ncbi:putative dynamin GTPase [Talaromyces proteolyticus]|uniref:Dynamin GTPase n=1 Tax=Talaromyces proteolyticus TaxID=1131652 RepID=A0AAD4L330_9EURO|nr:putative dynamin GTPase [Talaromyces proteolyticus]KAH8705023.1 putative dynamin GTPase [Talaromyces proteolyticus]